jgi:hypothetical protein
MKISRLGGEKWRRLNFQGEADGEAGEKRVGYIM